MKKSALVLALATSLTLVCVSSPVIAGNEPDQMWKAQNNFGMELVECTSYYWTVSEGARRNGSVEALETAETLQNIGLELIGVASRLMEMDTLKARLELVSDSQQELMRNDYTNISLLMKKYHDICQELIDNPESRLQYWLQQ